MPRGIDLFHGKKLVGGSTGLVVVAFAGSSPLPLGSGCSVFLEKEEPAPICCEDLPRIPLI